MFVQYVKDVIALNLVTLQFEVKPVAGVPPAARGYATVNLYDNRIFCIGGVRSAVSGSRC
jgi:hypothetical protein